MESPKKNEDSRILPARAPRFSRRAQRAIATYGVAAALLGASGTSGCGTSSSSGAAALEDASVVDGSLVDASVVADASIVVDASDSGPTGFFPNASPAPYLWGGTLAFEANESGLDNFNRSAQLLLDKGFSTIRFTNEPSSYDLGDAGGCAATVTADCAVQAFLGVSAFQDARLRMVIINLSDLSHGDSEIDATILNANATDIAAEYQRAFGVIYSILGNRGITVIIDNWEGDNKVYCGDAYKYELDIKNGTNDCPTAATRLSSFFTWQAFRQAQLTSFLASHPGFDMRLAVEFDNFHGFDGCAECGKTVFETIAANASDAGAKRPLCSYSSYDSIGKTPGIWVSDLQTILGSCENLVIGEFGVDTTKPGITDAKIAAAYAEVLTTPTSVTNHIVGFEFWNAFNYADAGNLGYGFYQVDGGGPANITYVPAALLPPSVVP